MMQNEDMQNVLKIKKMLKKKMYNSIFIIESIKRDN